MKSLTLIAFVIALIACVEAFEASFIEHALQKRRWAPPWSGKPKKHIKELELVRKPQNDIPVTPAQSIDTDKVAVNINIAQPLFDSLRPLLNELLVENLNNLALEDVDVKLPVALIGTFGFRAHNLKVVNATINKDSGLYIRDGSIHIEYDEIDFKITGDYELAWGSNKMTGSATIENHANIKGDIILDFVPNRNGRKIMKTSLTELSTPVTKFKLTLSSKILNAMFSIINIFFNGLTKAILGMLLSTFAKEFIIPMVNMILKNQISLGVGMGVGLAKISTKVLSKPTVTAVRGIDIPIGLTVVISDEE